jgi:hypothetical protein
VQLEAINFSLGFCGHARQWQVPTVALRWLGCCISILSNHGSKGPADVSRGAAGPGGPCQARSGQGLKPEANLNFKLTVLRP